MANRGNSMVWGRNIGVPWLLASLSVALLGGTTTTTQDRPVVTPQAREFDIPASSLEAALDRYARAVGTPLLYEARDIAGRRSSGVRGRHSARAALLLLLGGTGLQARYTRNDAIIIVPRGNDETMPFLTLRTLAVPVKSMIGGKHNYASYAAIVREELYDVLRTRVDARSRFRVRFRVWLEPDGGLQRIQVEDATISEAEVTGALRGARISESPPAQMPQPLRFELERR